MGVIDTYLTLLGALLTGVALLIIVFVAAMVQGPAHGRPFSMVLAAGSGITVIVLGVGTIGLAAVLLAPVLVVAVVMVVLAAMGYTAWSLLRHLARSGGR